MDTSETYIKMCKKAKEIQNAKWLKALHSLCTSHPWIGGDIFAVGDEVFMHDSCPHAGKFIGPDYCNRNAIWLPRQDQLQEMLYDRLSNPHAWILVEKFSYYSKPQFLGNDISDMSMEQLWLAFIMKEKYNKVWNGSDWLKVKVMEMIKH